MCCWGYCRRAVVSERDASTAASDRGRKVDTQRLREPLAVWGKQAHVRRTSLLDAMRSVVS